MPIWAIVLVVVSLVGVLFAVCFTKHKSGRKSSPGSDSSFEVAVASVRTKNNSAGTEATSIFETYVGDFDTKYTDRGNELTGFVKIQLKDNVVGYNIEGSCDDADGRATITEGFVMYSGDAWWVEETLSGADKGLRVLTEGKLDLSTNAFAGSWRANNGVRGHYTEFQGKNVSKTFRAGGAMGSTPQTLDQMLQEDIPTVDATVETPVFSAAPVVVHAVAEPEMYQPATPVVSAVPAPTGGVYNPHY